MNPNLNPSLTSPTSPWAAKATKSEPQKTSCILLVSVKTLDKIAETKQNWTIMFGLLLA